MSGPIKTTLQTALLSIAALLLFSVVIFPSTTKESTNSKQINPSPSPSPSPLPVNPLVIAVPQIATESIQLNQRLRTLPDRIVSDEAVLQSEYRVNNLKTATTEKENETAAVVNSGAVLGELEQLSLDWSSLNKDVEDLSGQLTKQLITLDSEIRSLKNDESRWTATATETRPEDAPPELIALSSKAVGDLQAAIKLVDERRGRIVSLQHVLAEQGSIVVSELENMGKAIAVSQRSLLEVDSPPLWSIQFSSGSDESLAHLLRRSYAGDLRRVKAFILQKKSALLFIGLITVCALIFFLRLRRETSATSVESNPKEQLIFKRPISLALLVGIFATLPMLHDAPKGARSLLYLTGVIPVIRLLQPQLKQLRRQMLIASIVSLLVWQFVVVPQLPLWIKRDLLQIFVIVVVAVFGSIIYRAKRRNLGKRFGLSIALIGVQVGILLLVIAFLANLFGYVGLADLIVQATLVAVYRGVTLYAIAFIGGLLISFSLRTKTSQRFATLRAGGNTLARRLSYGLSAIMLLVWIHQTLNLFAVRQQLYGAIRFALSYEFKIGSATVAVSSIAAFILTLLLGYLVAAVVRAILGEEILPRLNLARGLPNAIATVTHYVLLLVIFIFALAAAGVEFSKFTILTGALGVGLGFGLQNVVNNFVSGLILLFERPIRIGDILEVGGVSGEVTKIGFRSSNLHAFDGSDLIVPNAELISQRVINWTLTGTRRQIVMNIHVAYGNDPTQVRDLLLSSVSEQSGVLAVPKPMALFQGFGDSALNFELRFWAPRPNAVPELRSNVALGIAAALRDAGIKVPVPRRDLHITSDRNVKELPGDEELLK